MAHATGILSHYLDAYPYSSLFRHPPRIMQGPLQSFNVSTLLNMTFAFILGFAVGVLAWNIVHLEINTRKARTLNVPIVRIPFDLNNYVWVIIQPLVWAVLAYVPVPWGSYPDFVRFSHRNWHFIEKSSPTARFGPVWALVSPGGVHLYVSDADAIDNICSRWRDFSRPIQMYRTYNKCEQALWTALI